MEQAKLSPSVDAQGTQAMQTTRTRALAANAGSPAPATGFAVLLAALDALDMTDGMSAPDAAGVGMVDLASDAARGDLDASALAAWNGLLGPPPADGAPGAWSGPGAMANGAPGGVDPTALTLDGRPRGLVAETAKLDAGADLQDRSSPDIGAGRGHGFARGHNAQGWRPAGMGAAGASSDPAAGYARQHRLAIQADAASLAPVQSAPAAPGPQAAGATVQHAAAAQAAPVRAEAGAADVLSTVLAPALGQASSQTGHHGADPAEGSARTEGATAPEPVPADHAAVVADPNPGPDPVGAEVRLNHQVAYWVRQKTQGAELTVQREGQPVEVSLSLSGNHAHVSFRSDQPHTRELLDQGAAQLRDLLHSEGLVLSGMSVGMSAPEAGADSGAAAPSPHPRSGAHDVPRHQAQVLSMAPVGPAERVRGAGVVDIFV